MAFSSYSLQEKIEDIEAKVSTLSDQLNTVWATITSRKLADLPFLKERLDSVSFGFLSLDLESLARRIGFVLSRGEGISSVERVLSATVERSITRAWEKVIKASLGSTVFESFLAGAGVALIDTLFSSIKRAVKPRKLELPELEEIPRGRFPRFADYREVLPSSWFRLDRARDEALKGGARIAPSAGELIEKIVAERLRSFVN